MFVEPGSGGPIWVKKVLIRYAVHVCVCTCVLFLGGGGGYVTNTILHISLLYFRLYMLINFETL